MSPAAPTTGVAYARTMPSDALARTFAPVRRVRSFDGVVAQVRDAILSGAVTAGERLPSERELSEQFGVSRSTVREALRALEAVGLVEIRLGSRGGAVARQPDAAMLGQALSTLLLFQQASLDELQEFRHSFEAENAYYAALRASDDDIEVLQDLAAQARRVSRDRAGWVELEHIDLAVHEAIAAATKNQVRMAIMAGIHDTLMHNLRRLAPLTSFNSSVRKDVLSIVELIVDRNAEGAREQMQRHLERWQKITAAQPVRKH